MIEAQIGRRYATAFFEVAESNNSVKQTYEDLNSVMELYNSNAEFKTFVDHPLIKRDEKKKVVNKIFSNFSEYSSNIVSYLVDKNRLSNIRGIVAEFLKIYYEKEQIVDVEARFAIMPTEVQKQKLIEKLEKRTNKKVQVNIVVDESIISGGIIKIGDEIIDGSVKRQLEQLANK